MIGNKKKHAINIKTDFLVFSALAMSLLIGCIYILVNACILTLCSSIEDNSKEIIEILASNILAVADNNSVSTGEGQKILQKTILHIASNENIGLIFIKNNRNDKILFSNINSYLGKQIDDYGLVSLSNSDKKQYLLKKNQDYTVYFSYIPQDTSQLLRLKWQIQVFFICALLLSLGMSWILSQRILGPLKNLKDATKEFSKRNFDIKLKNTKYIELNELIATYNSMATDLREFYTSLETKIQERTIELEKALSELKNTQAMVVHSEKMKSLGELVAGVSHEINNPVNFIYGNLIHLNNYSNDLISIIDKYSENDKEYSQKVTEEAITLKEDIDYEFIKEDLPALIKSCREGTERTKNIVQDLKNFSRLDANVVSTLDLAKEIDTTLNILHNKIKHRITVHKEYAENMPTLDGLGGQLNQVFMNILDNAIFAIKDKGDIFIRLNFDEKYALIEFEDNGCGMSEETVSKIFDPFYTTKPVGQGTGLGMSISYKVIKTHDGTISVESQEGKGTIFRIKLPLVYTKNENTIAG